MKKNILFLFVLGMLAWAGRAEIEKGTNVSPIQKLPDGSVTPEPVEVRLTQDGGSQSVSLTKGRSLVVIIAGNPSTGYRWELAGSVKGTVLSLEMPVEFVAGATELVGAPGEYRFTFKAVRIGATLVSLKYVRPWEKDTPPTATATVNVTVTE
jgi:inhibitor of cysteine peptidase